MSETSTLDDRDDPVMICCAVTGSAADTPRKNPAVPVTPEAIAASALEAAEAGASIVHIHVRDPATAAPSMEQALYEDVVRRIRARNSELVINLTTGAGARFVPGEPDPKSGGPGTTLSTPQARTRHVLALRPEICSLDMGSMNMGNQVFVNTPAHLEAMARAIGEAGVLAELEVFEAGHVRLAAELMRRGALHAPGLFQICLGIPWGQPATPEAMTYMRSMLPSGALWFAFGIAASQFPMAAQAALLGGHVRVGLEDNIYLERGKLAPGNAALVEKAATIIRLLGRRVATPSEARTLLKRARTHPGAPSY